MNKLEKLEIKIKRRNFAVALFSVVGVVNLPKRWATPIVNAVILPTHAQMSACANILDVDIIGEWLFVDLNGIETFVEFLDDSNMIFGTGAVASTYLRDNVTGELVLDATPGFPPARATITRENNCIASEITISLFTPIQTELTAPSIGTRI